MNETRSGSLTLSLKRRIFNLRGSVVAPKYFERWTGPGNRVSKWV
jgi:hypothetical protein